MLKHIYKYFIAALILLSGTLLSIAQNEISSPYSMYGIGLLSETSTGAYDAMGRVGYAMQDPYLINFKNPASYVGFDSLSFTADIAFSIYSSTLSTYSISQKATYARPTYFCIGLPVTKHWRTSAGVMQYSNLGYNILDIRDVKNVGTVNYQYAGDGGLLQLYWGNAFKIYKGLSIGLNVSYVFGKLNYEKAAIFDGTNFFHTMVNRITDIDGINISAGVQYFCNINNKHKLGFGLVYETSAYVWTRQTDYVYNFSSTSSTAVDTINYAKTKGNMKLPQTIGGGISYQFKEKVCVTADATWQDWKRYYMSASPNSENLKNSMTYNFGLQFIPDANSTKYFKRIRIRAGARYTSGYITIPTGDGNTAITDFSFSLGLGFPFKSYSFNSSIGVLFEYGIMGTHANDLLRDNYFRFSLHFTLQEKWYQRVKLD